MSLPLAREAARTRHDLARRDRLAEGVRAARRPGNPHGEWDSGPSAPPPPADTERHGPPAAARVRPKCGPRNPWGRMSRAARQPVAGVRSLPSVAWLSPL